MTTTVAREVEYRPVPDVPSARGRVAIISWTFVFAVLASLNIVGGLETALHFDGSAIDGPFQLYNALRRITAGQTGGVDFQFFHGLLIPYLHYLPYRLFGGTFAASEITRQLVSGLLYPLSVLIFLRAFIGDWRRALVWATAVMAMSIALRMLPVLIALNSLLGVRSTLPTLLPVVFILPVSRRIRVSVAAVTLGVALSLSTEQGLAVLLAITIATVVMSVRSTERMRWIVDAAAIVVGGLVTLMLILVAIGGVAGMRGALRYNFKLVPMDQYWYFGAPPNIFVSSWHVLPRMLAALPRMPEILFLGIVGVAATGVMLWRDANRPAAPRRFALAVAALYGLISCTSLLGTYVNAYIQPLTRVLLLLGAVLLDELYTGRSAARETRHLGGVARPVTLTTIAACAYMVFVVPSTIRGIGGMLPHFVRAHLFGGQKFGYTGIWPATIAADKAVVDLHRGPHGEPPTVWSTYTGLLEARIGLFNPSFDYIIHALGPDNRAAYVETFRRVKPALVQTMSPGYTQYEAWIEQTSWDFYAELLRHYDLTATTPWSMFWARRASALPAPPLVWESAVDPRATSVVVPGPPPKAEPSQPVLVQVELDYQTRNRLRALPIVGNMPRFLVSAAGATQEVPVTLDPYVKRSRFPLVMWPGRNVTLSWEVRSLLPGASIAVTHVRLYQIPLSPSNQPWLAAVVRADSIFR